MYCQIAIYTSKIWWIILPFFVCQDSKFDAYTSKIWYIKINTGMIFIFLFKYKLSIKINIPK